MNLVAPFGFFGAGNIGDESTLQGFARLISSSGNGFHIWVASRNPKHTSRIEPAFRYFRFRGRDPRRRWANFRAQAQVIVGGTPIMDILGNWPLSELTPLITTAHQKHKRVAFVGSGVEDLKNESSKRIFADQIAPFVNHWAVRSERDRQRLLQLGIRNDSVTVAADLAWLLDPVRDESGSSLLASLGVDPDRFLVGINVTNEQFVLDRAPRIFDEIARFLDLLVERHQAQVVFFANDVREGDSFDKAAARKVLALMENRECALLVPNEYRTPQETLSLIDCCDLTISARYHFCLFSALQSVPFIALQRSDKVADLCWDLNWAYGVPLGDLDANALLTMSSEIIDNRDQIVARLGEQHKLMRGRASNNLAALDAVAA